MTYREIIDKDPLDEWESSSNWKIRHLSKDKQKKPPDTLPDIATDDGIPSDFPTDIVE